MIGRESFSEYAQRRANETGRAYFVSGFIREDGSRFECAMVDCRLNRRTCRKVGHTFAQTFKPQRPARGIG